MLLEFHGDIADVPADPPTVSSIIYDFNDALACWGHVQPLALSFGYCKNSASSPILLLLFTNFDVQHSSHFISKQHFATLCHEIVRIPSGKLT